MPDPNWVREYQDGQTVPGTPYRIIRLIGAGGMGSVYEVEHVELGRRYVLKSLLGNLSTRPDLAARMRNEWRALGQVQHPNIVDVLNAGTTSTGIPFYVMELLSGETVRERLEREPRIAPDEAARIAQKVLEGLQAAHAIGIVHRDVKPANVFLTEKGEVRLLDFGIAKIHFDGSPKITARGLAVGTPRYMSPEQAAGELADARSDIYAVGLLLYEMITGRGPFDDCEDHASHMDAHLHRVPTRLVDLVPVHAHLSDVVARALEKEPEDRFQTASEMAAALSGFAEERAPPMRSSQPTSPAFSSPSPLVPGAPLRESARPPQRWIGESAHAGSAALAEAVPVGLPQPPPSSRRQRTDQPWDSPSSDGYRASSPSFVERESRSRLVSDDLRAATAGRSGSLSGDLGLGARFELPSEHDLSASYGPLITRATLVGALAVAIIIAGVATLMALRQRELSPDSAVSGLVDPIASPPLPLQAGSAEALVPTASPVPAAGGSPSARLSGPGRPAPRPGSSPESGRPSSVLVQPDWNAILPPSSSSHVPPKRPRH